MPIRTRLNNWLIAITRYDLVRQAFSLFHVAVNRRKGRRRTADIIVAESTISMVETGNEAQPVCFTGIFGRNNGVHPVSPLAAGFSTKITQIVEGAENFCNAQHFALIRSILRRKGRGNHTQPRTYHQQGHQEGKPVVFQK